jgi:hypothetical protein
MQPTITLGRLKGLLAKNPALSATMLASVAGMPVHQLTAALRGALYLGCEWESELFTLALRAEKVIDAILPLQIAPGDGATLKLLVQNNRSEDEIRTTILSLLEPTNKESTDR